MWDGYFLLNVLVFKSYVNIRSLIGLKEFLNNNRVLVENGNEGLWCGSELYLLCEVDCECICKSYNDI